MPAHERKVAELVAELGLTGARNPACLLIAQFAVNTDVEVAHVTQNSSYPSGTVRLDLGGMLR